ncbi:MAG: DUF4330 domain-containing protein [Eubacteriales bacterium]|jgi:hypothetical protein
MKANKTSRKGINIIDLVFFVVLAAVIVFAVVSITGILDNKQKGVQDNVMFSIETTKNDPEFLNYVEEGKTIYDGATKKELGKIVAIHEKPAREIAENHESKTIEYVEIPNKVDVILEVEGKATMEYPNIIIDTVSIKVGKRIDCIVGDAAVNGTVISLDYDKALLKKKEAQSK